MAMNPATASMIGTYRYNAFRIISCIVCRSSSPCATLNSILDTAAMPLGTAQNKFRKVLHAVKAESPTAPTKDVISALTQNPRIVRYPQVNAPGAPILTIDQESFIRKPFSWKRKFARFVKNTAPG